MRPAAGGAGRGVQVADRGRPTELKSVAINAVQPHQVTLHRLLRYRLPASYAQWTLCGAASEHC